MRTMGCRWPMEDAVSDGRGPGGRGPGGLTVGPGGVWYSRGAAVRRLTRRGVVEHRVPDPERAVVDALAWGRGGPVWFADRGSGRIGAVHRGGRVTVLDLPAGPEGPALPEDLAVGPGPNVWVADRCGGRLLQLDPRTGRVDRYPLPDPPPGPGREPETARGPGGGLGLVCSPDGALWLSDCRADRVGRRDPDGTVRLWALPEGSAPGRGTVTADGAVWFPLSGADRLGRVGIDGRLTCVPLAGCPAGITTGRGGQLYVSLFDLGEVVRVDPIGTVTGRWPVGPPRGPQGIVAYGRDVCVTDPAHDLVLRLVPGDRP